MEKVVNQLGQTVEFTRRRAGVIVATIKDVPTFVGTDMNVFFKDSEFNPVLLKDGSIIPYYRYNGQIVEISRQDAKVKFNQAVNSLPSSSNVNFHHKFLAYATTGKKFYFDPVKNCIFFTNGAKNSIRFSFWLNTGKTTNRLEK